MAFDWEHNLGHHKTYIGDQTLYAYFEDGFTVTFNSNGGRLKAEDPDVREIDTTDYEDNLFFQHQLKWVINLKAGVLLHLPMRIV